MDITASILDIKCILWIFMELDCDCTPANTLFKTENDCQKTELVPIPLPRASRNFPHVKTRNNFLGTSVPIHLLTKTDKWDYLQCPIM